MSMHSAFKCVRCGQFFETEASKEWMLHNCAQPAPPSSEERQSTIQNMHVKAQDAPPPAVAASDEARAIAYADQMPEGYAVTALEVEVGFLNGLREGRSEVTALRAENVGLSFKCEALQVAARGALNKLEAAHAENLDDCPNRSRAFIEDAQLCLREDLEERNEPGKHIVSDRDDRDGDVVFNSLGAADREGKNG